jgi:hypothetical protein
MGVLHNNILDYLTELDRQYQTEAATEHTYRSALERLLSVMLPHLSIVNESKRQSCGAPDYVLSKDDIPTAFVETKNINDTDLAGKKKNKEQFDRYKLILNSIIFTDCINGAICTCS